MSDILTAREVSKLLKVSLWSVYESVKRKELPSFTIGKSIRFSKQAIEAYAQNKQNLRKGAV